MKRTLVAVGVVLVAVAVVGGVVWGVSRDDDGPSGGSSAIDTTTTTRSGGGAGTTTTAPPVTVDPDAWTLVWSDGFDGPALDTSLWVPEDSDFGSGGGQLQCYLPGNVFVEGGNLVLEARQETVTCGPDRAQHPYTAGMVRGTRAQAFGAWEVRARMAPGYGLWSAAWLLPRDYPFGREGRSGELDIVEVIGREPSNVVGTLHWDHSRCGWGCSRYGRATQVTDPDAVSGFHTYRLEWTPERVAWFVDGQQYYAVGRGEKHQWASAAETPAPNSATYPEPFVESNPMYPILSLSVGGRFPHDPDATTVFPVRMEVDRIDVYAPR